MPMFLIEVEKIDSNSRGKLEPVDVIVADNGRVAMEEADRRYSRIVHVRRVSPLVGNMIDLTEKGLKLCPGGSICAHESDRPHLVNASSVTVME